MDASDQRTILSTGDCKMISGKVDSPLERLNSEGLALQDRKFDSITIMEISA